MPTLSDEEFIAQAPEIEKQLEATLKASETPAPTPAAVETPPPVETPPAAPVVETPPAAETPPAQPSGSPDEPAAKTPEGDTQAAAEGAAEGAAEAKTDQRSAQGALRSRAVCRGNARNVWQRHS